MGPTTELDRHECLALLGSARVGRVAYTERALPAIIPVTYALVGTSILFRTGGDGLALRLDGQVIAFEVDDADPHSGADWSVLVTGIARALRQPPDLARLQSLGLADGADPNHGSPVSIVPGSISGRRVVPARSASVEP